MPVERDVLALPVLGEIAAGQPIEAYEDGAESLDVPPPCRLATTRTSSASAARA